ncbi:MAG: YafY family transcriptional regulator [Saprospiraceae bacterium]|nr:YafY family transcriptional regulator [Saprospiraceae bacterium]MCF8252633.1 YafY family transcriptional regulator [Saprospiraceae bacterium]MCF8314196.1 YafY family transcriptional regulator [Saprospiraceae bacterium]MCF8442996.1 YafY family transcriptional regulator [Saprospiraceae bacterium]
MNRTDRLMGLVAHLQSKKYQTAGQLAEHFGMSERTVYRDLRSMNEIGVPVGFEAGRGYYIVGGYFLPPVSLTAEEANALALTEPLVLRFADKEVALHVGTALTKIKMALGGQQRDNLENLQSRTAHYIPEAFAHMMPSTNFLTIIQNSIVQKTILKIEYANAQDEVSSREVEPIGLTFYSLNWHLIGWCHLRNDYRDFRTSRIRRLSASLIPFRKTDHIELNEYLANLETRLRQEHS